MCQNPIETELTNEDKASAMFGLNVISRELNGKPFNWGDAHEQKEVKDLVGLMQTFIEDYGLV